MSGQLRARRRRRGGRGRGRRQGAAAVQENQGTSPAVEPGASEVQSPPAPDPFAGPPRGDSAGRIWLEETNPLEPDEGNGRDAVPAVQVHAPEAESAESAESGPAAGRLHLEIVESPTLPGEKRAPRRRRERGGRRRSRGRRKSPLGVPGEAPPQGAAPGAPATVPLVDDEALPALEVPEGAEKPEKVEQPHRASRSSRGRFQKREEGTKKTLIVNRTGQETRVAILEEGTLAEIFIERETSRGVIGNIYKGRVSKVLPGMQSAFVRIGLERDAFLYVSDISPGYDAYEGLVDLDEVEGGQEIRDESQKAGREDKIEKLLKEGQELLVQVTKEPIGTKGPRITSYVTLPGRFLVLMPQVDNVGVSRKIDDARERTRLRRIVDKVRPKGMGFIVRTVAEACDEAELEADALWLLSQWDEIRSKAETVTAPAEVRPELSIVPKMIRDLLTASVQKIVIDDDAAYKQAVDLVKRLQPAILDRIQRYAGGEPIFDSYGVQAELDKALRSRVWLRSGGSIVINQTEALVAIDVNTGKFVGKRNLEDTVLKTNLEAATEIVRQLRLRDLGGIIVVDFIDMEERKSKRKLIEAFEKELRRDRARTKVLQISDFGLVEITRQRTKKSLERILCRTCPYCTGTGRIKTDLTMVLEIRRELEKIASSLSGKRLVLRANPDVAHQLEVDGRKLVDGIRGLSGADITIRADATLHHEQFEITNL